MVVDLDDNNYVVDDVDYNDNGDDSDNDNDDELDDEDQNCNNSVNFQDRRSRLCMVIYLENTQGIITTMRMMMIMIMVIMMRMMNIKMVITWPIIELDNR